MGGAGVSHSKEQDRHPVHTRIDIGQGKFRLGFRLGFRFASAGTYPQSMGDTIPVVCVYLSRPLAPDDGVCAVADERKERAEFVKRRRQIGYDADAKLGLSAI